MVGRILVSMTLPFDVVLVGYVILHGKKALLMLSRLIIS